jgi:hypothetical protein
MCYLVKWVGYAVKDATWETRLRLVEDGNSSLVSAYNRVESEQAEAAAAAKRKTRIPPPPGGGSRCARCDGLHFSYECPHFHTEKVAHRDASPPSPYRRKRSAT